MTKLVKDRYEVIEYSEKYNDPAYIAVVDNETDGEPELISAYEPTSCGFKDAVLDCKRRNRNEKI